MYSSLPASSACGPSTDYSSKTIDKMFPATPQFEAALGIVGTLRAAGYEAYLAGGCVRDLLLGREPEDYDVATSATPDVVLRDVSAHLCRGRALRRGAGVRTANETKATIAAPKWRPSGPMASIPTAAIRTRCAIPERRRRTCSGATSPSTACCWIRCVRQPYEHEQLRRPRCE